LSWVARITPLLREPLKKFLGPKIALVDSAANCAAAVKKLLGEQSLAAPRRNMGRLRVALTDSSSNFLRVAEEALGLQVGDVQLLAVQNTGAAG